MLYIYNFQAISFNNTISSYILACLRGSLPLFVGLCHGLATDAGCVGGDGLVYVLLAEAGQVEGLLLLVALLASEQHIVLVKSLQEEGVKKSIALTRQSLLLSPDPS